MFWKLIMVTCGFILQNEYVVPWDLHLLHIHSGRFKKYGLQNDLTSSLTLKDIQHKLLNVLTSSFTHSQVVHLFGSVSKPGGRG